MLRKEIKKELVKVGLSKEKGEKGNEKGGEKGNEKKIEPKDSALRLTIYILFVVILLVGFTYFSSPYGSVKNAKEICCKNEECLITQHCVSYFLWHRCKMWDLHDRAKDFGCTSIYHNADWTFRFCPRTEVSSHCT